MTGVVLLALLAATLLVVLRPWWRGDATGPLDAATAHRLALDARLQELSRDAAVGLVATEQLEAARHEAAQQYLSEPAIADKARAPKFAWGLPLLLAAVLAAGSGAWYFLAGSWETQSWIRLQAKDPQAAQRLAAVSRSESLRKHLARNAEDAAAWAELGALQYSLEAFEAAAAALERANALDAQQADWLVAEGEALAQLQGRTFDGAPARLFLQALAQDPDHPRALWNAGLAALSQEDPQSAYDHWQRLSLQPLPESTTAQLQRSLTVLAERLGMDAPAAQPGPVFRLQIAASAGVQSADGDALFVFVRDADAPGLPPLAARRLQGKLPVTVTIDQRHQLLPNRRLADAKRWEVGARLSQSGSASAASGDREGRRLVGATDLDQVVEVLIDQRIP